MTKPPHTVVPGSDFARVNSSKNPAVLLLSWILTIVRADGSQGGKDGMIDRRLCGFQGFCQALYSANLGWGEGFLCLTSREQTVSIGGE